MWLITRKKYLLAKTNPEGGNTLQIESTQLLSKSLLPLVGIYKLILKWIWKMKGPRVVIVEKEQIWKVHISQLQNLVQAYCNQNSVIFALG